MKQIGIGRIHGDEGPSQFALPKARSVLTEVIENVLKAGYIDAFRKLYADEKGFTFPAFSPRLRLDYAFLSPDLQGRLEECRVANQHPELARASDHLPLLTILRE
jgi:exonuclease III